MTNPEALALLKRIDIKMKYNGYKPTIWTRNFLINIGSQCRTPQKMTEGQSKQLERIYRVSQGGYKKEYHERGRM